MRASFARNIAPFVQLEIAKSVAAQRRGCAQTEFIHLENAHVLGQESTVWHVRVHILMLLWALRYRRSFEFIGQLVRIGGAATKTVFGWVPRGNTGGANVSAFKALPIRPEHSAIIHAAKRGA